MHKEIFSIWRTGMEEMQRKRIKKNRKKMLYVVVVFLYFYVSLSSSVPHYITGIHISAKKTVIIFPFDICLFIQMSYMSFEMKMFSSTHPQSTCIVPLSLSSLSLSGMHIFLVHTKELLLVVYYWDRNKMFENREILSHMPPHGNEEGKFECCFCGFFYGFIHYIYYFYVWNFFEYHIHKTHMHIWAWNIFPRHHSSPVYMWFVQPFSKRNSCWLFIFFLCI